MIQFYGMCYTEEYAGEWLVPPLNAVRVDHEPMDYNPATQAWEMPDPEKKPELPMPCHDTRPIDGYKAFDALKAMVRGNG